MSSKKIWAPDVGQKGEYIRQASQFRNIITADGSSEFLPEKGRYHLYVSLACPWAGRVCVVRALKGLHDVLPCTIVHWHMTEKGWAFGDETTPICSPDPLYNFKYMSEVYYKADPEYQGRFTVPVLWDKKKETIVNNESSEIIRMLNTEFNEFCQTEEQRKLHFYPADLRAEIDDLNSWIYPTINNGVYRSGFAQTQEAYDEAVIEVFHSLDKLEEILSARRYLTGNRLTEADIRLFSTLVRFDMVYHQHFKCNKKRIIDYPHLWGYVRDIYQIPGVSDTVNREHITQHYQKSHPSINKYGIVAIGPDLDFFAPHGRENME